MLLGRDAVIHAAEDVAALVGAELGWTADHQAAEVAALRARLEHERSAGGLPETVLASDLAAYQPDLPRERGKAGR